MKFKEKDIFPQNNIEEHCENRYRINAQFLEQTFISTARQGSSPRIPEERRKISWQSDVLTKLWSNHIFGFLHLLIVMLRRRKYAAEYF